jgi:DHA1 family multidrug resistance protein-like MFS transporter
MLAALLIMAVATVMPVWLTSAPALFVSRLLGGLAAGMYDPAARGIIADTASETRRGEAFGLYASFQMGGLILGPVVGSATAVVFGAFTTPFVLTAGLILLSAGYLFVALGAVPAGARSGSGPRVAHGASLAPGGEELSAPLVGDAAVAAADAHRRAGPGHLRGLVNPLLLAAVVMQLAFSFSTGVYEVIWSLYLDGLGASLEWIGLTFTLFGIPVVILSPLAGRLVDRFGGLGFALGGGLVVAASGIAYTLASEPVLPAVICLVEGCGYAFVSPGLFWLLARGTPRGRTSTVQGIFGAAGTVGFIVAALVAGVLWGLDARYPFYFFVVVAVSGLVAGGLIARGRSGPVADPATA